MIRRRIGDAIRFFTLQQSGHRRLCTLAIVEKAIHAIEIAPLHPAVKGQQPVGMLLTAAQMMHNADERILYLPPHPPIKPGQRRVIQLILQEQIKWLLAQTRQQGR